MVEKQSRHLVDEEGTRVIRSDIKGRGKEKRNNDENVVQQSEWITHILPVRQTQQQV